MKIGIDLDNTITEFPDFFRVFCRAMRNTGCEVTVITNREPGTESEVAHELKSHGIEYDRINITDNKPKYIMEQGITVFIDDTDEYMIDLPESVFCLKPREPGNFDFEEKKWIYGQATGYQI